MSHPQIIGLNGVARAGKDTVADILHQLYGYTPVSFSDLLNKALIALDPWVCTEVDTYRRYSLLVGSIGYEEAKEYADVRRLLQRMGTEVGRELLGQDIWVDALFKNMSGERVAITNVRFPNEYNAVKDRGGEVWRVNRPGFSAALGHVSDTALDDYTFDHVISNDGSIHDLAVNVMSLLDPVQVAFR